MSRFMRLAITVGMVVLVGGSSLAGVKVAQHSSNDDARRALEARIANLEALRSDLAGSKARIDGLGIQVSGLSHAVTTDGHTVKVTGEAYLPSTLNALIVAFQVAPTRSTIGASIIAAQSLADHVTAAVRRMGVASSDVRTAWDGAFPTQTHGFTGQARVLVTVRRLSNLDRVAKAAQSVSKDVTVAYLNVSDESDVGALADARAEALSEARDKALLYAQSAGRKIGQLKSVSEQVSPEAAPAQPGEAQYSYRPSFIIVIEATFELA